MGAITNTETTLAQAVQILTDLAEDTVLPKSARAGIQNVLTILIEPNGEAKLRVSKALNILEELSEETNLPSFARTQIFSAVGLLVAQQ